MEHVFLHTDSSLDRNKTDVFTGNGFHQIAFRKKICNGKSKCLGDCILTHQ